MSETPNDRLKQLLASCIAEGPVTLSSGKVSDFYLDGRLATLSPEGSLLIARAVLDVARELGVTALGGPTVAACPMVSAAGVLAAQEQVPLKLFYVRSQRKGHGMQKAIEGPPLTSDDRALIVDDTMTSGGSLLQAVERVREEAGAEVVSVFCLVDRQEGGTERLTEAGVPCRALFRREDFNR